MAVVLEVFGAYYWYPDWTQTFQTVVVDNYPGSTPLEILQFTWPDLSSTAAGLTFYGAVLNENLNGFIGLHGWADFGWQPE